MKSSHKNRTAPLPLLAGSLAGRVQMHPTSEPTLQQKFRGCLLGATIGDVAGAPVEAESPEYIARTYTSIDDILNTPSIPEFTGPDWQVGRFTDDTQMTLCVTEWLLEDDSHSPESLLARFVKTHEPWRRYGPATQSILRLYPHHKVHWHDLATASFPHGSYGNGSAMRVAPVGLAYFDNLHKLASVATASSRPTHTHPLAYQGAVLQAAAVATAVRQLHIDPAEFLDSLRARLTVFSDLLQDTAPFAHALDSIERGLARGVACREMSATLGTGVTAHESVPIALYCFLRHPNSYADVIHQAVFLGGDTDTIASMAGALSGAFLGKAAIPEPWLDAIREDAYSATVIETLADRLFTKFAS
jgi:poly(ADP-ribose) glycohydrolase ARH3